MLRPRSSILLLLATVLTLCLGGTRHTHADEPVQQEGSPGFSPAPQQPPTKPPQQVLAELLAGNERFIAGESKHPHESSRWRASIEKQQHPQAVVLGCADSRVPPEIIFDQGLGDLFVVRVAGNIVDTDVTASIEYAVDHLGTQLVVVLGHTNCGAVTAAYRHLMNDTLDTDEIESLLYRIEPALTSVPREGPLEARIDKSVRNNVDRSIRRLAQVPDMMKSLRAGRLLIVGAIYDLHTGRVELSGTPAPSNALPPELKPAADSPQAKATGPASAPAAQTP